MATGAACCGAGALCPMRPRRDGVSEETQEQGGLPGEPWVGGMTRFSAGDCGKEAPQVPRAHASSQTTCLALGPLPPTQPSHSLSRTCLRGVGPGRYGQPGLHPSALWCRGGVRVSCAQRSWTEGGPLAEAQEGRGGDGGKTGPEMQHSCDTTALAQRESSSHRLPDTQGCLSSSSGKRGCAHLPAEGSVPPGPSQSSPMFHTQGQSRGLMLQNRGSGSWPRGTSCFVLVTAVLREETQASPLHPPYTHSGCSFCCGFGPRSLMATPARCLGAALGAS